VDDDPCPIPKPAPLTACAPPTFKSEALEQSLYRQMSLLGTQVRWPSPCWFFPLFLLSRVLVGAAAVWTGGVLLESG
jgi:hypothetical protein